MNYVSNPQFIPALKGGCSCEVRIKLKKKVKNIAKKIMEDPEFVKCWAL